MNKREARQQAWQEEQRRSPRAAKRRMLLAHLLLAIASVGCLGCLAGALAVEEPWGTVLLMTGVTLFPAAAWISWWIDRNQETVVLAHRHGLFYWLLGWVWGYRTVRPAHPLLWAVVLTCCALFFWLSMLSFWFF